jgi:hypothetical protein
MSLTETIERTIEEVKNGICNDYCRHPNEWDAEKEGYELYESDICDRCPLNRL